jgi:outer membrane protein
MRSSVVLPLVVLALSALPLFGQSNDVAVWVGRSSVGTTNESGTEIHFDRGDSIGASFNHFWGDHFSGELAVFGLRHDGSIRIAGVNALDVGRLRIMPVTATLQWHLDRSGRIDPYLGGGVAYARSDKLHSTDLDNAGVGSVKIKSRFGWAAVGGVSYAITQPLAVAADVRYIGYHPSSGPSDASVRLKLSPVIYSLGLRWRF